MSKLIKDENYKFYIITTRNSSGTNNSSHIVFNNLTTRLTTITSNNLWRTANIQNSNNIVEFGKGTVANDYAASSASTDNGVVIPYQIYGIK